MTRNRSATKPQESEPIDTRTVDPVPHVQTGLQMFRCVPCGVETVVDMPLPWEWFREHSGCGRNRAAVQRNRGRTAADGSGAGADRSEGGTGPSRGKE